MSQEFDWNRSGSGVVVPSRLGIAVYEDDHSVWIAQECEHGQEGDRIRVHLCDVPVAIDALAEAARRARLQRINNPAAISRPAKS